ncbi:hypothetical protein PsalN5692_04033 (plasmid) [Piscirickettsia salmonis]|uniref:hypothetical protein n=1 Tax=Piscirickettsia salmonis TaxID=1238 RepID=UPI0012B7BA15|nr:hypothetical protein [Piscirickettsia salmonis]QGP52524.1 hypothetical protein PsalN5692_04033 [Piscirickettsia salmonis]
MHENLQSKEIIINNLKFTINPLPLKYSYAAYLEIGKVLASLGKNDVAVGKESNLADMAAQVLPMLAEYLPYEKANAYIKASVLMDGQPVNDAILEVSGVNAFVELLTQTLNESVVKSLKKLDFKGMLNRLGLTLLNKSSENPV